MARIFTTPAAEAAAKAWMHDVMAIAGFLPKSQRSANQIYFTYYSDIPTADATKICDELINRDFKNIDASITKLSHYRFYAGFEADAKDKKYSPENIAKAIVYMAECFGLYWDDTLATPYEVAEFKKTILGTAVYQYGRYISAIKDKPTKAHASSSASTPRAAGAAPKNNYKQTGPQSGNARGLLGNPGDKVYADTAISYRIEGDKVQSNTPRVFIKPLTASGADGNNSNKVYISSGNGYTDCTCYFDDANEAQKFLDKIIPDLQKLIDEKRAIANITNLHVAKVKSDSNGYFLVSTEYGPCAVSAKTLNEALSESVEEVTEELTGWAKATKDYSKEELKELHTWMRKD
jgi:hypothetical protein